MNRTTRWATLAGAALTLAADKPGDPMAIDWSTVITTLVVFGLLLLILRVMAWKPIMAGLQKREDTIRESLEVAERAKAQAEAAQVQYAKQMEEANANIRAMMDEARADAQRVLADMQAKAKEENQQEKERLRREIDTARDQALQQIYQQTVQLATLISAKAIRKNLSADDHGRLADEAIAELKSGKGAVRV